MKEIRLLNGQTTWVDDEDYKTLTGEWGIDSNGYAIQRTETEAGWEIRRMHNIIMGAQEGMVVDHIDRDKLNNTRSNLRHVTNKINALNRSKRKNCSSKYIGVSRVGDLYKAQIWINGVHNYLGIFELEEDAALAYNRAALDFYGNLAHVNDVNLAGIKMTSWRRYAYVRTCIQLKQDPVFLPKSTEILNITFEYKRNEAV